MLYGSVKIKTKQNSGIQYKIINIYEIIDANTYEYVYMNIVLIY